VSTLVCAGLAQAWAGELEAAADTVTQAVAAAQRAASGTGQALALLARCEVACQRGDLPAAYRDAGAAAELFAATGAVVLAATASAAAIRVQLMRGEQPASQVPIPGAAGHPYLTAHQYEVLGMTAAARADRTLALRHYLGAGRHLMTAGIVSPACSAWRSRAVTVLAGLGRAWEARTLAASEITLARAWGAPGPLGRALAAAATAHDGAARRELLTEAVDVLDGTGYQLHLARALIRLGAHTGAERPTRAVRDLLDRGHDLAQACGAATLAATALRAMTAAGARPRAGRPAETLTAAERRVAELVVTGMSSQAVAASLILSKRTVDTHLGRIYRKLGIPGRDHLHQAITGTAAGPAVP
jgi:DNA-binding CsgD family transcriptional regulator